MGQFNDYLRAQLHNHAEKQDQILRSCLPPWFMKLSEKHPHFVKRVFKHALKIKWRQLGDIIEVKFFGKIVYIEPLYAEQKKHLKQ